MVWGGRQTTNRHRQSAGRVFDNGTDPVANFNPRFVEGFLRHGDRGGSADAENFLNHNVIIIASSELSTA